MLVPSVNASVSPAASVFPPAVTVLTVSAAAIVTESAEASVVSVTFDPPTRVSVSVAASATTLSCPATATFLKATVAPPLACAAMAASAASVMCSVPMMFCNLRFFGMTQIIHRCLINVIFFLKTS